MELLKLIVGIALGVLVAACSGPGVEPDEPHFQPGEYGGTPMPGTEYFLQVRPSPGGDRVAIIREFTPGNPMERFFQLWLTGPDGTNPELLVLGAGSVDWSPDGRRLAITAWAGLDTYVLTVDVETREVNQWTGLPHQVISMGTASAPVWFQDGRRLLVSVHTTAYQQPYDRGIYIIDTIENITEGPFVTLMQTAGLSDEDKSAIGTKYLRGNTAQSGNIARYDFANDAWEWITFHRVESGLRVPPAASISVPPHLKSEFSSPGATLAPSIDPEENHDQTQASPLLT